MGYGRKTILGAILCKFIENRSTFSQELKSDTWAPKATVAFFGWSENLLANDGNDQLFLTLYHRFESSVKVFKFFFSIFLNYQFF